MFAFSCDFNKFTIQYIIKLGDEVAKKSIKEDKMVLEIESEDEEEYKEEEDSVMEYNE